MRKKTGCTCLRQLGASIGFGSSLPAGQTAELTLPVSQLIAADQSRSVLRVGVWGATEAPADPDHHINILVNGQPAASESWDGKGYRILEAEFETGYLHDGDNTVSIS